MHEHTPPLIHRDFRPPNILIVSRDVTAPIVAKIADFGLTITNLPPSGGELRTWQWLGPEVLDSVEVNFLYFCYLFVVFVSCLLFICLCSGLVFLLIFFSYFFCILQRFYDEKSDIFSLGMYVS